MKASPSLIALMIFLGAIALYTVAISPLNSSLGRTRAKLAADEVTLQAMETDIALKSSITERTAELEATNAANRLTLIRPMLNSYAMRGKSYLDALAQESGLTGVEYTEGTFRALPIPRAQLPQNRTARRSVQVKAVGDYAAAASFVMRVERDLGLVTLQSLTVEPLKSGNTIPDSQSVTMVFEWPCEGEVIK